MQIQEQSNLVIPEMEVVKSTTTPFIEANTKEVSLSHLSEDCVIPVFSKDNEMTISHQEFIETAQYAVNQIFGGESISLPEIRISHIVKGRVPSAIGKPVKELLPSEKTLYYERMMFAIEIPSISQNINGNDLTLTVGGVRAYNQENLYNKKSLEKFKFFVGFKNMVCCNMCISSDGFVGDLRVGSILEMKNKLIKAIEGFSLEAQQLKLEKFHDFKLSEKQFAQLIGRFRLYNYLPKIEKNNMQKLLLNDGQIASIAKQYYEDENFSRGGEGEITLWNFYNLLTGANKSSYIDTFLDRSVNAFDITQAVVDAQMGVSSCWYLS